LNNKGKTSLRLVISTMLTAALIVGLNQGCGKPQESKTHPSTQAESTSEAAASEKTVVHDDTASGHFNMGIESAKKGDIDEAIKAWEKAIEKDPKHTKAHNYLARSYYTKERFDDALNEYKKIVELDPANANAHVSIGFVYRMKEMHDDAIAACNKALQINPQLAKAYNCLGTSYVQKKMYTEAVDAYKKALAINPNHADAQFGLGIAYESAGKPEEAKQAFDAFDAIKDKGSAPQVSGHGMH
jgi:tetratricopeptide (TPR) repeat protein